MDISRDGCDAEEWVNVSSNVWTNEVSMCCCGMGRRFGLGYAAEQWLHVWCQNELWRNGRCMWLGWLLEELVDV